MKKVTALCALGLFVSIGCLSSGCTGSKPAPTASAGPPVIMNPATGKPFTREEFFAAAAGRAQGHGGAPNTGPKTKAGAPVATPPATPGQ